MRASDYDRNQPAATNKEPEDRATDRHLKRLADATETLSQGLGILTNLRDRLLGPSPEKAHDPILRPVSAGTVAQIDESISDALSLAYAINAMAQEINNDL